MSDHQPPGTAPVAVERADRFLKSATGRAVVHRTLTNLSLPRTLADDLCQEALRRVFHATEHGTTIENPEGFVRLALHRAAVDIVRGRVRSVQTVVSGAVLDPDVEERSWSPVTSDTPLDVEVEALAFEPLAAVRRAIHQRLGSDPAVGAAALAYLAVTVDGAATPPDCPQPVGGASPKEAADWAALWYAGRDDCFPTRDDAAGTPPAVRKRRSRASERFHLLLRRAAVTAGLSPDNREGPDNWDTHGNLCAIPGTPPAASASLALPADAAASVPAEGSRRARAPNSRRELEPEAAVGG